MTKEFFFTSYALLGIPMTRLLWLDLVKYCRDTDKSEIRISWNMISQHPQAKALLAMTIWVLWLPYFIVILPSMILDSVDWMKWKWHLYVTHRRK